MPSYRDKPGDKGNFLKRRTFEQGKAEFDAAHRRTRRLYCEVLAFWRHCRLRTCRRHRRCMGEPTACIMGGFWRVRQARRLQAQKAVMTGGPRRIKPATHVEWFVRSLEMNALLSRDFGERHS